MPAFDWMAAVSGLFVAIVAIVFIGPWSCCIWGFGCLIPKPELGGPVEYRIILESL